MILIFLLSSARVFVCSNRFVCKTVLSKFSDCGTSFVNLTKHKKCPKRQKLDVIVSEPDLSSQDHTNDNDSFRVPTEAPPALYSRSTRFSCSESSSDADSKGSHPTPHRRVSRRKRLTSPKGQRRQCSERGNVTSATAEESVRDFCANSTRTRRTSIRKSLDRRYKRFRTLTQDICVDDDSCSAHISSTPTPLRRSSRIASNRSTRERDSSIESAHSDTQDDDQLDEDEQVQSKSAYARCRQQLSNEVTA
jgi:hypothetical protein